MSEEIKTFEDLFNYCKKYANEIYIRDLVDGKWKSISLSELDMKTTMEWIHDWWKMKHIPFRLKTEEEIKNAD